MKIKLYTTLLLVFSLQFLIAQNNFNKRIYPKNIKSEISIFPNPATDYFKVSSPINISKIEIYNLIGKKVKTLNSTKSNYYDVSDLRNGIYLIRILDINYNSLKVLRLGINNQGP